MVSRAIRFALPLVIGVGVAAFASGAEWQRWRNSVDVHAIEPASVAGLHLAYDSITPPMHSTAMCADGWYTFANLSESPCRGHRGVLMRTDHIFTPEEFHAWKRARDSIAEAVVTGRAEARVP